MDCVHNYILQPPVYENRGEIRYQVSVGECSRCGVKGEFLTDFDELAREHRQAIFPNKETWWQSRLHRNEWPE